MNEFREGLFNKSKRNILNYNSPLKNSKSNFSFISNSQQKNNLMSPIDIKLPYLNTNPSEKKISPQKNYLSYLKDSNYGNNLYNNKLIFGLPVIIHKSNNHKNLKKNTSNFIICNKIQETFDTSKEIFSPYNHKKEAWKKLTNIKDFYDRMMKKSKTEERLDSKRKPDLTVKMKKKNYIWWKLIKYFIKIYYFFTLLKKFTKKVKNIRKRKILENKIDDYNILKNWMIDIQGNYWNDLINYKNISTSFDEYDSIDKINRSSNIIIKLMNQFFYNLESHTNIIEQVPHSIILILYKYIKKNSYFPQNFMNEYLIKKLKVDFYGSCLNNTLEESAFILCYLLISCVAAKEIFLNIKFIFKKLRLYENISITFKYMASIFCHLERKTFADKIKADNNYDYINLVNYFRCNKIRKDIIEKENNIYVLLGIYKRVKRKKEENIKDEYELLIDDKIIDKFWAINSDTMNSFSDFLFKWSMKFSNSIINKFENKK